MGRSSKAKDPQDQPKPKKKRGFLGWLLILFMIFVMFIGVGSGAIYFWKLKWATVEVMKLYGDRLAVVIGQHYNHQEDQKFISKKQEYAGRSDSLLRDEIIQMRQNQASTAFHELIAVYEKSNAKDWHNALQRLNVSLKNIFSDRKISPEEFTSFLEQVQKITNHYRTSTPSDEKATEPSPKIDEASTDHH